MYFGVPGVTAGVLGKATLQADSRLAPIAPERSLSDLPSAACKDFHLSLHPSGHVHLRAHGAKPFASDDMGTWLPVTTVRNWAYFFSDPLDCLGLVTQLRRRDAVVAFPEGNASVEVHIDLIPSAQPYPLHSTALDTVIGLAPPHYGLRVSVFPYKPVHGTIFFASREPAA